MKRFVLFFPDSSLIEIEAEEMIDDAHFLYFKANRQIVGRFLLDKITGAIEKTSVFSGLEEGKEDA